MSVDSLLLCDRETGAVIVDLGPQYCNRPAKTVELNRPDQFQFAAAWRDELTVLIEPLVCEIQAYRDGNDNPVFVGPIMHVEQSDPTWDVFTALDPRVYLARRFWGETPWAREWFLNPRFDDDLDHWDPVDTDTDPDHQTGTQSALVGGSITQSVTPDLSSNPWGAIIQAWVKIPTGATWTGRGLEVRTYSEGVGGTPESYTAALPTDIRDTWTAVTIQLPAMARFSNLVETTLDVNGDGILCDRLSFRINQADGVSIEQPPNVSLDAGDLIADSSDGLNLDFRREGPAGAGVAIDVDRFIDELLAVATDAQICDFSMEYTPTSKTLVQWVPRMGADVDPEDFSFTADADGGGNFDTYSLTRDYTKARSEVVAVGDEGFRGVATDPSAWGGLRLSDLIHADSGTLVADLEAAARRDLRTNPGDVTTHTIVPKQSACPLGTLGLGDRIYERLDQGSRQIDGMQRVAGWSEDWDQERYASVTLVAEPPT